MMVYQHHERLDGSGYPAGLTGDEIHPWARICAVADVFDAMTCQRSYRRAIALSEVYSHLLQFAGKRFDAEVVECWAKRPALAGRLPTLAAGPWFRFAFHRQ
jgi:HD-GYP domain-containing protein (c-di-GMP phosphodiesterase class II)